jgi:PilZ domain
MSFSEWSALIAYILTIAGSMLLAVRASNWRIRLLGFTVGLLPLCQAVVLLGRNKVWIDTAVSDIAEMLELLASALCLTAVHLLNVENRDRKSTDTRLRVFEGSAAAQQRRSVEEAASERWASHSSATERRRELRLSMNCPVTITVLGIQPPWTIPGTVVNLSGRGLGLNASSPIALQSPVKVESDDLLLLGEVCRCQAVGEEFSLGLQVQEWLALPAGVWRVKSSEQPGENLEENGDAQSNGDLAKLHKAVSSSSVGDQHVSIPESALSRNP